MCDVPIIIIIIIIFANLLYIRVANGLEPTFAFTNVQACRLSMHCYYCCIRQDAKRGDYNAREGKWTLCVATAVDEYGEVGSDHSFFPVSEE